MTGQQFLQRAASDGKSGKGIKNPIDGKCGSDRGVVNKIKKKENVHDVSATLLVRVAIAPQATHQKTQLKVLGREENGTIRSKRELN